MKGQEKKDNKCRCYINAKYYARVAKTGKGTFQGYKPCPIHEKDEDEKTPSKQEEKTMKIYQVYYNSIWADTFNTFEEAVDSVVFCFNRLVSYSICEPITIVEFIK